MAELSALSNTKEIITSLREECLKEYRVYDGQLRVIEVYQAPTDARQDVSCMKTEMEYDGTSNRIIKKKETIVKWQSSWDI